MIFEVNQLADTLHDLTLLIEVSPMVARSRAMARDVDGADRIGGRDESYHAKVAAAFARFAEAEPERFARISGDGAIDVVHRGVLSALVPLLGDA